MDNVKQNNRREEVIVQHYSMVTIPCSKLGYSRLYSWVKGRDRGERKWIRRLEQRTMSKNQYNNM